MMWEILFHPKFEEWFDQQEEPVREAIASILDVLEEEGPLLGRPYVDTIKDSRFTNMKELRVQHQGRPWRVLFAFDPKRRAILLVGGDKGGEKRWYKEIIPIAEQRFEEHLKALEEEQRK
jgi:hypothetical protein